MIKLFFSNMYIYMIFLLLNVNIDDVGSFHFAFISLLATTNLDPFCFASFCTPK